MKIVATVIITVLCHGVNAQKLSDTLINGNTFIRFNVINLADVSEPNISFGVERRLENNFSVALDAAYIVYSQRFHSSGRSSGFIIRPAVRYFPGNSKLFFEAELHYKQHTHHIHDWIGRDAVNGVPSYEEFAEFRLRKQVIGPHLKIGRLIPVSGRLWCEVYLGIGLHFRKYTVVDHPDLIYSFNQDFIDVTTGEREKLMAMPAGLRILYRLR